jgi:NACalpha-BTF3-like transcription factor
MFDYMKLFDEVLNIAGNYDGVVYGSYVTDIIIPKLKDENFYDNGKEINLWFNNKLASQKFIRDIKKLVFVKQININHYEIYHNDAFILNLTILISPVLNEEISYMYVNGDKILHSKNLEHEKTINSYFDKSDSSEIDDSCDQSSEISCDEKQDSIADQDEIPDLEELIMFVVDQTCCTKLSARRALINSKGDVIDAILKVTE